MGYKLNLDIKNIKDANSVLIKLKRIRQKIWKKMMSQFSKDFNKTYRGKWLIHTLDNGNSFIFIPTKIAGFGAPHDDVGFDVLMTYDTSFTISHTKSMWKNTAPSTVAIAWNKIKLLTPKELKRLRAEVDYKLKYDSDIRTKSLEEFKTIVSIQRQLMITQEQKDQIKSELSKRSTTVDVDTNIVLHHANDDGPTEYKSIEVEMNINVDSNCSVYYEGENVQDIGTNYYLYFEDEAEFEANKKAAEEINEITDDNREGIIAIIADENDHFLFIHDKSIESDCSSASEFILDELDTSEIEFEESDGPDYEEYDPDDPRY